MRLRDARQFGTWIRGLRRARGLTQVELAGLAGVGPRFIVELEAGKPTAELGKALHVAHMLGGYIDIDDAGAP
jgi:y4mF family transcriptional regulator